MYDRHARFQDFWQFLHGLAANFAAHIGRLSNLHHHAQMKVGVERHIAKAISYRIAGTTLTLLSSYIITGSATIATSLTVVELCVKPVMYFLHERVWYKFIPLGLHKDPE